MVAAAMKKTRVIWSIAAIVAFAYLAAMVITGALPESHQLVKFEAAGVMSLPPEAISRVELARGGDTAVLTRSGDAGWNREGKGPLSKPLAEKLSLAVQFMNTARPVRAMAPAEYRATDPKEFGLDKPMLSIALANGTTPTLSAHFGGLTPDGYSQYMAVDQREELFLMSLFVGKQWIAIADEVFAR